MSLLRSIPVLFLAAAAATFVGPSCCNAQTPSSENSADKGAAAPGVASRGKKLVLKDGSFQLIREYQKNGERVRYFSAERGVWEEIPAAMVDWDATGKAESAATKGRETLLKAAQREEAIRKTEMPLDVDASLPVAPGVFLPPGEGMFVVEEKSVTPLDQVGAEMRTDKKQRLKQVLSPVPIVPSKRNLEIPSAKAIRRINSQRPEFYLREAPPDPDQISRIQQSSRPGESSPEIELVRLTVKGGRRQIQSVRSLFDQQISEERNSVMIQRWDVAKYVYRFTLGQELPAGEYAFVQILPDGVNLYVWDFGVDRKGEETSSKK